MPAAYILQSESSGKFYIGSAEDFPSRLAEHLRGYSPYTRNRGPFLAGKATSLGGPYPRISLGRGWPTRVLYFFVFRRGFSE